MVTSITQTKPKILPYKKQGEIDYTSLGFDPFERPERPDGMQQIPSIDEIAYMFKRHFTNHRKSPSVFAEMDVHLCYDQQDLSRHVRPDVCIAFGVDAKAIRERQLYLPWEVGKAPDWVLEVGSDSTGGRDLDEKPIMYEQMGVQEYWRFDPSGGRHHGVPLGGDVLVDGKYQPVELTRTPDGVLKAYSPVLGLYLCWVEQPDGLGHPALYDAVAEQYLKTAEEVDESLVAANARAVAAESRADAEAYRAEAAEAELAQERQRRTAADARADAAETELQRLREQMRQRTND